MKIIHHRNDLAVFHTGRYQHGKGPNDLAIQALGRLDHAAVLDAGELILAANGDP